MLRFQISLIALNYFPLFEIDLRPSPDKRFVCEALSEPRRVAELDDCDLVGDDDIRYSKRNYYVVLLCSEFFTSSILFRLLLLIIISSSFLPLNLLVPSAVARGIQHC